MSCERARKWIDAALVQELDGESARRLREHLASCEACAAEASVSREVWSELGGAAMPRPRPDALARLEAAVARERFEVPARSPRTARLRALAVAIAFASGVLVAVGVGALWPDAPAGDSSAPGGGGRYLLVLSATNEPAADSAQLGAEMAAWIESLTRQGVLESVVGLADGPPVGVPPGGPLMGDDVAGLIVIRAASAAEARRMAVQSPSIRYGGLVEVRALD